MRTITQIFESLDGAKNLDEYGKAYAELREYAAADQAKLDALVRCECVHSDDGGEGCGERFDAVPDDDGYVSCPECSNYFEADQSTDDDRTSA